MEVNDVVEKVIRGYEQAAKQQFVNAFYGGQVRWEIVKNEPVYEQYQQIVIQPPVNIPPLLDDGDENNV